jgi:hypothetical protein
MWGIGTLPSAVLVFEFIYCGASVLVVIDNVHGNLLFSIVFMSFLSGSGVDNAICHCHYYLDVYIQCLHTIYNGIFATYLWQ